MIPDPFFVKRPLNKEDFAAGGYFQQHCADNNGTSLGV